MIVVKYFGVIAEHTNSTEEQIGLSELSLSDCVAALTKKHSFEDVQFSIALNQNLIDKSSDIVLRANDELAFLPPFAGG